MTATPSSLHDALDAWIDAHFDDEVRFLQALVRVPTDTPPAETGGETATLPAPTESAPAGPAQLAIRGVTGVGDPAQEAVTIVNVAGEVSLAGWTLHDEQGNMSGQVMRPGRADVVHGESGLQEVRAAYAGYIAYFGRFEVNEAQDTVVHHVQGSLIPGWVGGHQVRRLRFDGDLLILSANVRKGGGTVEHVLTWRRIA